MRTLVLGVFVIPLLLMKAPVRDNARKPEIIAPPWRGGGSKGSPSAKVEKKSSPPKKPAVVTRSVIVLHQDLVAQSFPVALVPNPLPFPVGGPDPSSPESPPLPCRRPRSPTLSGESSMCNLDSIGNAAGAVCAKSSQDSGRAVDGAVLSLKICTMNSIVCLKYI